MKHFPGLAALACMGLLAGGVAQAVEVKFSGRLVEQPDCVLNAGKDIAVNFADVAVKKIDGVSYKKMEIPYTVSCSGGSPNSGQLKVMLDFTPVSWGDYNPLQTTIPNLGLRIVQARGIPPTSARPSCRPTRPTRPSCTPCRSAARGRSWQQAISAVRPP